MPISKQMKKRIGIFTQIAETTFHYGYIPLILYLGKCLGLTSPVKTRRSRIN